MQDNFPPLVPVFFFTCGLFSTCSLSKLRKWGIQYLKINELLTPEKNKISLLMNLFLISARLHVDFLVFDHNYSIAWFRTVCESGYSSTESLSNYSPFIEPEQEIDFPYSTNVLVEKLKYLKGSGFQAFSVAPTWKVVCGFKNTRPSTFDVVSIWSEQKPHPVPSAHPTWTLFTLLIHLIGVPQGTINKLEMFLTYLYWMTQSFSRWHFMRLDFHLFQSQWPSSQRPWFFKQDFSKILNVTPECSQHT